MIPNRDWHDHDPRYCISTFQDLRELLPRVKKGTKTIWTRPEKYRECVHVIPRGVGLPIGGSDGEETDHADA